MSIRIGLAVSSDSVRVVAVRDNRIVWSAESPITDGLPLHTIVSRLLGGVGVPRWPRARVFAAIGPSQAQVKRLTGLPPVTDPRVLAKLVQESPGRFFLKNGIPLAITGLRIAANGEAWSGALDEPVVQAIAEACRDEKLALRGVVPTVLVLGKALEDGRMVWRDGDVAAELSLRDGGLDAIRRIPTGSERDEAEPEPRPALRALGDHCWRFADAYAAAMTRDDEPIASRPGRGPAHEAPRVPRWRLNIAIAAVVVAALTAAVAPGLIALRTARRAAQTLGSLAPNRVAAVVVEAELRRVSEALDEASTFQAQRRSPTVFLSHLADVLPPTAQLVAVRLDSAGGNLVLLGARAGDALSKIDQVDAIDAPEIVGPVTREYVGQQEKERITIHFRWHHRVTVGAQ